MKVFALQLYRRCSLILPPPPSISPVGFVAAIIFIFWVVVDTLIRVVLSFIELQRRKMERGLYSGGGVVGGGKVGGGEVEGDEVGRGQMLVGNAPIDGGEVDREVCGGSGDVGDGILPQSLNVL